MYEKIQEINGTKEKLALIGAEMISQEEYDKLYRYGTKYSEGKAFFYQMNMKKLKLFFRNDKRLVQSIEKIVVITKIKSLETNRSKNFFELTIDIGEKDLLFLWQSTGFAIIRTRTEILEKEILEKMKKSGLEKMAKQMELKSLFNKDAEKNIEKIYDELKSEFEKNLNFVEEAIRKEVFGTGDLE